MLRNKKKKIQKIALTSSTANPHNKTICECMKEKEEEEDKNKKPMRNIRKKKSSAIYLSVYFLRLVARKMSILRTLPVCPTY